MSLKGSETNKSPNTRGPREGQGSGPPTATAEKNYTSQTIGKNEKGSVWIGAISKDGATTSAVSMKNEQDGYHQLTLDIGPDKLRSSTTSTSPGRLTLKCGMYPWITGPDADKVRKEKEALDSCMIHAENGNIDIIASNGNIRMEATDIELVTKGEGEERGHLKLTIEETINVECKKLVTSSKVLTKLCSSGDFEEAASGVYSTFASLINNVTDAVQCKPSKFGGQRERQKNSLPSENDSGSTIGNANTTQYSEDYLNTGGWDPNTDGNPDLTADDAPSQY